MYVCMCVCMYVCMYVCMHVCTVHQMSWQLHHSECKKTEEKRDMPTFHCRTEGSYKRLRSAAVTELSPGMRPTSDPFNMIGREAGLTKRQVEYYTGDRVSEKV